jgi:hypothetical protein
MKSLIFVPVDRIENKIFFIRGNKIMFDRDLAELYGVTTKRLNEQVKRNKKRFLTDFMFRLNKQEINIWESYIGTGSRSQIATLKKSRMLNMHLMFLQSKAWLCFLAF